MASRLQDVLLRGLAASRPAAADVANGTLYYSTDTFITEQSDGTTWNDYTDGGAGAVRIGVLGLIIEGASGGVITTGVKGFIQLPFACTILEWTLLSADAAVLTGSIVVDIWKDVYANYPPTVADTITAAAKPTIAAATKNQSSTLTGWTTAIAANDVLGFNVDSISTFTKVVLELKIQMV